MGTERSAQWSLGSPWRAPSPQPPSWPKAMVPMVLVSVLDTLGGRPPHLRSEPAKNQLRKNGEGQRKGQGGGGWAGNRSVISKCFPKGFYQLSLQLIRSVCSRFTTTHTSLILSWFLHFSLFSRISSIYSYLLSASYVLSTFFHKQVRRLPGKGRVCSKDARCRGTMAASSELIFSATGQQGKAGGLGLDIR